MKKRCHPTATIVLAVAFAISIHGQTAPDAGYEVEGKIRLGLHHLNGGTSKDYRGEFKVYVNSPGWLIQTIETNDFGVALRREIGTTNGTEMFELDLPYAPLDMPVAPTNVWGAARSGGIGVRGFVFPSAVPVGTLDNSFTGHLWLMFASGNYLLKAPPGQLVPVFAYNAWAGLSSSLTVKADWGVFCDHGWLPASVRYFEQGDEPTAVYKVTAATNAGSVTIPAKIHFEQPLSHHKDVDIEVTSVRAGCSLTNLLPVIQRRLVILNDRVDSRHSYTTNHWTTLAEARAIYAKAHPPEAPGQTNLGVQPEIAGRKLTVVWPTFPAFSNAIVDFSAFEHLPKTGEWKIATNDLKNPFEFARLLMDHKQPISGYVWTRLGGPTKSEISADISAIDQSARLNGSAEIKADTIPAAKLVDDLNRVIEGATIYDSNRFSNVLLSGDTARLAARYPSIADTSRFNRLLLEDAFPLDIVRSSKTISNATSNEFAQVDFRGRSVSLYSLDGSKKWTVDLSPALDGAMRIYHYTRVGGRMLAMAILGFGT